MKRFVAVAVFGATVVAATAGVGCKKDPPQQPQPLQPTTGYPPNTGYPPAGNTGYPTNPGPAPAPAPAPTAATPTTSTGCDPSVAAALQPLLQGQVVQNAPGAKPEGTAVCGMLQEGQSLQVTVNLAAGGSKCYTGLAIGAPSFTQLDLQLVAAPPPPLPPTTLSQSSGGGPLPVMAGKPNCFKNLLPVPIQANFKLTATKGSGPAMAQLYMKLRNEASRPQSLGWGLLSAPLASVGGVRRLGATAARGGPSGSS